MTALFHDVHNDLKLVTGPIIQVMTVSELKQHLRIEKDDDDALLEEYIQSATAMLEEDAEIALFTQTHALYLDCFPDEIELRKPPIQSVSSIVYLDADGDSTTLSSSLYRVDANGRPGRITPAYGQSWPTTYPVNNAITVTFVCGDTTLAAVPNMAKQGIRMLCGHWYKHRESVISTGAQPIELSLAYGACVNRLKWCGVV